MKNGSIHWRIKDNYSMLYTDHPHECFRARSIFLCRVRIPYIYLYTSSYLSIKWHCIFSAFIWIKTYMYMCMCVFYIVFTLILVIKGLNFDTPKYIYYVNCRTHIVRNFFKGNTTMMIIDLCFYSNYKRLLLNY